jgi:indole-3-glycerol phosphate synthase
MSEVESTERPRWPARRFSQAISEGDGISIIPVVRGDVPELVRAAEEAGAEALAVESISDVRAARTCTELPILLRGVDADATELADAREAGADAFTVEYRAVGDEETLGELQALARELGLDCPLGISNEEELEEALEWLDPEIVLLSARERDRDAAGVEHVLDLLSSVPVGKLVVSESRVSTRDEVVELEAAGVDALIVDPGEEWALSELVAELVGAPPS